MSDTTTTGRDGQAPDTQAIGLLNVLPTALILADEDGQVLFANAHAASILGCPAAELAGHALDERLAPLASLLAQPPEFESGSARISPASRPDLHLGYRLAHVSGLPWSGSGAGYAIVFQDLRAADRLREERDRLLRLAAVGDVLPALLHEIKNPLAAITTSVEVLAEEVPEGHVRRELTAVLGEVRRIQLALEGIGMFRHELRSGHSSAVDTALREAFLVLERQMKAKGVKGVLLCPRLPLLPFDAAVLRALLFNLATNALHACAPGDSITVEARFRAPDKLLELRVADTGCGMTPEVLSRCRELFFTTKPNGTGVGLTLCASVVERSGGELLVESTPGQGTMVAVRLPASLPAPSPGAEGATPSAP